MGEFSAIIGLIRRAQRVYGRLFTVSGVICAFRRAALYRVGLWNDYMVTEDIDILAEYALSLVWAYVMQAIITLWVLGKVMPLPPLLYVDTLLPRWHGVVLAVVCMMQFATSLVIERRYEAGLARHFFWVIWYPLAFWALGMFAAVVALPRSIAARHRRVRARWVSPDRGVR